MAQAAQESLIHQVPGRQVGREDHQHVKRHLQLAPGMQGQVIDPVFQRNDPAVEQVARAHLLAAKVVDQQDPAVGFHLERRLVKFVHIVEHQVQAGQGQLAADDDKRPADAHPARVAACAGAQRACPAAQVASSFGRKLVVDRVIQLDHLAIHVDRIGDVHGLGQDQVANGPRHAGFPVPGRAVQEDGCTRIDRRSNAVERSYSEAPGGEAPGACRGW